MVCTDFGGGSYTAKQYMNLCGLTLANYSVTIYSPKNLLMTTSSDIHNFDDYCCRRGRPVHILFDLQICSCCHSVSVSSLTDKAPVMSHVTSVYTRQILVYSSSVGTHRVVATCLNVT